LLNETKLPITKFRRVVDIPAVIVKFMLLGT